MKNVNEENNMLDDNMLGDLNSNEDIEQDEETIE